MVKEKAKTGFIMIAPIAWIAFAAGLQMVGAFLYFKTPIDIIIISTGTLLTFSVYLLNRFTDKEDSYNCPEQKMFFQRKSSLIAIPISILAISYVILAISGRLLAWHIVLLISGIFYSINFVPVIKGKTVHFIRLKDIVFLKNILVSFLWGISPFAFAISLNHILPPKNDLIVVLMAFCLTALINSASTDVRDMIGDKMARIVTFANFFGKKITVLTLFFLTAICSIYVVIVYSSGQLGKPAIIFFISSVVWSIIAMMPIYIRKLNLPKIISEPINDSQVVFNGLFLIILALNV